MTAHPGYYYKLPDDLLARSPAEPRDSSRLFIYASKTDESVFDVFSALSEHIPPDSLLILNDTRVIPARLELTKASDGTARILFLVFESASIC
jgi:S-adenosylmethionine:tRNA ribosyltransferase-isomerase